MNYVLQKGVGVSVTPNLIAQDEQDGQDLFLYSYEVEIVNNSHEEIALQSRHWIIRDGRGKRNVIGDGVVGEQPVIPLDPNISTQAAVHSTLLQVACADSTRSSWPGKEKKLRFHYSFCGLTCPKMRLLG